MNGRELYNLGAACRYYRTYILCVPQTEVANETGYSVFTISSFENGRNNNAMILSWYIKHGLTQKIIDGINDGGMENESSLFKDVDR